MMSLNNELQGNSTERLRLLIDKIQDENLYNMIKIEFETMLIDNQRLIKMLEQRSNLIEDENNEIKLIITDIQTRYEKAVREMQFFKKKYNGLLVDSNSMHKRNPSTTSYSQHSSASSVISSVSRNPSIFSSYSNASTLPSNASVVSTSSIIQQRKFDPLSFGGSDPLWDTITKSQGNETSVEKMISNFLRRGGSPNTAKQSPSLNNIKYGYGMIHALIAIKAPNSLDILLKQGANPNAMPISNVDEDKLSPCYLAASIGWLTGLRKLVQAGGDLLIARGEGSKKKTALHVAAEHGHLSIVEFIINVVGDALSDETDSIGANALHYACISGNTDVVSFLINICQVALNEPDHKGELPLHWAAKHGNLEIVTMLVQNYRCNINAYIPKKLGTPYDLAKSNGHKRVTEYLKNHGGLTGKKMDKRRDQELANQVPQHLESVLAKNGFFMG